jgi:hypothetical protein
MATAAIIAIQDQGATAAANVTQSATVGAAVAFTLTSNNVFDENEDVVLNVATAIGAGGACQVRLDFVLEE